MTVTPIRPTDTLRSHETAGQKIKRLEAEARTLARQEASELEVALINIAGRCNEVAEMTSLPVGEREVMRKLAEEIDAGLKRKQAIGARS